MTTSPKFPPRHRSPDRFSLLTYLSTFYHKLSPPDSGISSLSQSPSSSDNETEFGRRRGGYEALSGEAVAGRLKRSNSSVGRRGGQRGAIHSLMDGRRVRSLSCGGGGRRGGVKNCDGPPLGGGGRGGVSSP